MLRRPAFGGLVVASLFLVASLTPSLLPRHWAFQGMVTGIVAAIGYGVGALLAASVRRVVPVDPPLIVVQGGWLTLMVAAPVGVIGITVRSADWQQELHRLTGMPQPSGWGYLVAVLVGLVLAALLVLVGRAVRLFARWIRDLFARWLPPRVAGVAGLLAAALIIIGLLDGIVGRVMFAAADSSFSVTDRAVDDDVAQPTSPRRSGSPHSPLDWDGLGSKGRAFVAGGPTVEDLAAFRDGPVVEPIRVYAGLEASDDDRVRAELVADELERTGAFERAVLCVAVPSGTGWIDPEAAAALEYLWAGDTAIATMQYSYLPSWLSFAVDSERAREAGTELFNAVYRRWTQLPQDDRPLLLVFGESLGVHGSEAAFSGIADIRNRTDGALWVGPPSFSKLWRGFTERRDPDTFERRPVYDGGATVRFASEPQDLEAPDAPWYEPRVVYLQHPSDPVVWWSPRLLLRRPDWLEEPQGDDVLPDMRWYPLVTFWQITFDMANAQQVPPGHGHGYGELLADAWSAIASPPGWTDDDTHRLRDVLAEQIARNPVTSPWPKWLVGENGR